MDLQTLLPKIRQLPAAQQAELLKLLEALEEAKGREKARTDFLAFVKLMWPGFVHGRHHEIMADAFERVLNGQCKRLIINMPPRHRLALGTPVPTPDGWKTVGDILPGDRVFAPSGEPILVTGKSPVFEEDIYEVETSDGQVIECDGEHLWTLRFGSPGRPYVTISTKDLLDKLTQEAWAKSGNFPILPPYNALQMPDADLIVPPYVLGAWLGDGASSCGTMAAHPNDAPHIRARFEMCGIKTTDTKWNMTFGTNGLVVKLRELGVLGNKHIPDAYLFASIEQRVALLQGLMDTDGNVQANGKCEFNNSNRAIIDGVLALLHGLGVKARVTERMASYEGKPSAASYRIMFKFAHAASLPRKAERCRAPNGNSGRSVSVRKTDRRALVQCLEVENEDGLFLAGRGCVVTHNTKSEFASFLLPAWFVGRNPGKKVIQATHTAELAVNFGRKVRNLIASTDYQQVFRGVGLQADSKAAGRWATSKGGEYFAVGVGGAIAGKGADLFVIDDPHTEQEAMLAGGDNSVYDRVFDWYTSGPRQRLQPNAAIVVVMTRWANRDLTGRLVQASIERDGHSEWEVIELPAIMPSGEPLWPQFWSKEAMETLRAELPPAKWLAQYQQQPTAEEGAILKREWWKRWKRSDPPNVEYILICADTAYTKNNRSDYSAFTVWGVWNKETDDGLKTPALILLDAWKDRLEFPELKARTVKLYKEWQPDAFLIEAKASGLPLIHELRQAGVPVSEFVPTRASGDKIMRANSIADIFHSGMVWAPERRWADEVIEECAAFPNGDHDDFVDTVIMALMRYRSGGFIRLPSDWEEEEMMPARADYY